MDWNGMKSMEMEMEWNKWNGWNKWKWDGMNGINK